MFFKSQNFKKIVLNWVNFFFPTIAHVFFIFWVVNCSSKNLQFFIQTFFQLALDLCFWSQSILHQHRETEENINLGTQEETLNPKP
jgi:hypothetical protein